MSRSLLLGCLSRVMVVFWKVPASAVQPCNERAREHVFQQLGLADTATEDEFFLQMQFHEVPDFHRNLCRDALFRRLASCRLIVDLCGTKICCYLRLVPRFEQCSVHVKETGTVRRVFLLDNLALVLFLTKGRARSFHVLAVIRRIYGIAYRTNC